MHVNEVLPRDAIPGIDDPSRAYPVRILNNHEIVNDSLPGGDGSVRPIAVTWCPICASAVVYDRRVDGRTLTFGTSGKLADDALVMYDRETGSEWKQPLGRAIAGPLEGTDLAVVPSTTTTWERFRAAHPDGAVLQPVHEPGSLQRADEDRREPHTVEEMRHPADRERLAPSRTPVTMISALVGSDTESEGRIRTLCGGR
jgi:hypothetical protein